MALTGSQGPVVQLNFNLLLAEGRKQAGQIFCKTSFWVYPFQMDNWFILKDYKPPTAKHL